MDKKNKIKIVHCPTKPQSPDYRNKNRIVTASVQINNIKRYLDSVKHKSYVIDTTPLKSQQAERENMFSSSRKLQTNRSFEREDILRKRIEELQFQNNEFRMMQKDYEALVIKNRELQDKMLMLLSQLELSQSERGSPIRNIPVSNSKINHIQEYSTIENVYTEQSSKESVDNVIYPKAFKNQASQIKGGQIQAFNNVIIDKEQQSQLILLKNKKEINEYIEQQVKSSMQIFQARFVSYLQTIEQQMREMKITNEELLRLKLGSSSNSQSQIRVRVKQSSSKYRKQHLPQFYVNIQRPMFNTPQIQQQQNDLHDNSLVNIEMENISDSQHSFGKTNRPKHSKLSVSNPFYTPDSYPKIQSISSSRKNKSEYSQELVKKVLESLASIRENLTFLLGQQTKFDHDTFLQFQSRIFEQLQHIIATFFPFRNKPESSLICHEHLGESLLLRSKTFFANKDEREQKSESKNDKDAQQSEEIKDSIIRKLNCNLVIPSMRQEQFQQTQRKLIEIIEIMKSFNQQYRQILQKNESFRRKSRVHYPQNYTS